MHRTETVDVGVVLEGETYLILDDGSETLDARAGDVVVQRGHQPRVGQSLRSNPRG